MCRNNGKLYGCKFESDPFSFYGGEMVAQILDVDEIFSGLGGGWQDLPSDVDLEQLFGLLGMSDSEELSMLLDLMEDPEKLFIDAQKEEVDGTVRYCFDLDADYFESYFDEAEKSLVEQYAVSFKNRSACVYIAPKKDSLRLTLALRQSVNIDKRPYIVTTAFDIGIDLAAKAPYVINDVLAVDRFGGGPTVRDVDCGYAEWQKASDLSSDGSLYYHIGVTLWETLAGFAIAVVLGFENHRKQRRAAGEVSFKDSVIRMTLKHRPQHLLHLRT